MVKCSIIIPAYNSEQWIIKCLDSIPKQENVEIIVINDCSTDNTINLLNKYKKTYKDLIIINLQQNKGVSYARNRGIDTSNGEYILMLDSDDYIYPKIFNEIIETYLCRTYDLVFFNIESNKGTIYPVTKENYTRKYGNYKFIKRSFLGDLRYTVGKQYAEDKELHLKLMAKLPRCIFSKQVMYHYNYPRVGSLSAIGEHR